MVARNTWSTSGNERSSWHIIEELNTIQTAEPGKSLELSIDFHLQNIAYRELKEEFIIRRAKAASIVVLDVDTGEVLAIANQPSYNPHKKLT
ncbi:MAG: hypothetical protein CM1200mP40_29170 [Gammaproteobacteria bacterium]|nr:MAG: hypothetical protein CM1200mP40_29170 [Gammaproteobacteria bacterium]